MLLGLAAVGRGGQGDVGQRIRDEILYVQSRNNAKVTSVSKFSRTPQGMYHIVYFCSLTEGQPEELALC